MVGHDRWIGKGCEPQFVDPPWSQESAEWRKIDEELPENHTARRVVAAVERLNLQPLFASYSAGGSDALRPDLMLKVVLIEVWSGRQRPSQWFKDMQENIAIKWAGFGIRPSRSSWYNFRDRVGSLLDSWFGEVVQLAQQEGITPAKRGSLDGSLVAANASRHRLLNKERLAKRREELATACTRGNQADPREKVPSWRAKTPRTRREQAKRYEAAQARLSELQAINQRQNPARRRPGAKIVVSATDPEAALGLDKEKVFRPLYNVQLVSDLDSPLTLGYAVFAQNTDGGTLSTMLRRMRDLGGVWLSTLVCDASYVTGSNLAICDEQRVTLYGPWQENDYSCHPRNHKQRMIPKEKFRWLPDQNQYQCPEGHRLMWIGREKRIQADGHINTTHRYRCSPEHCRACQQQRLCTKNPHRGRAVRRSEYEDLIETRRLRMGTEEAKAIYRLRKQTVELSYADMKENRLQRKFSGRGLFRARIQIGLTELVRNLMIVERELENRAKSNQPTQNTYNDTS